MQIRHDFAAVLQPRVFVAELAILGVLTWKLCRRQERGLSELQRVSVVEFLGTLSSCNPGFLMLPLPHHVHHDSANSRLQSRHVPVNIPVAPS